jgi:hypothetical protein
VCDLKCVGEKCDENSGGNSAKFEEKDNVNVNLLRIFDDVEKENNFDEADSELNEDSIDGLFSVDVMMNEEYMGEVDREMIVGTSW